MKMKFIYLFLFSIAFVPTINAQESGLWEKAFARPHGAILVSEVLHEPERFLLKNKGSKVTIAGKFRDPDLAPSGNFTRAGIVWGGRYSGVACLSNDKQEMLKVIDIVPNTEVLATGIVTDFDRGWMYLEQCTIEEDVTLFHSRDPKFILGTWCSVYEGQTQRMLVFTRNKRGQYLLERADPNGTGGWKAWSGGALPVRVKRISASHIETAIIGRTADYSRQRFTINSSNQMSRSDGFQFYRCRSLAAN